MDIICHEGSKQFHLFNDSCSYIIGILPNGEPGQLYFGKRVHDREDYGYLVNYVGRAMFVGKSDDESFSLEANRREYPSFGTGDYRQSAFSLLFGDGSHVSTLKFDSFKIFDGKPKLNGLPAVYAEEEGEAKTLELTLKDELKGIRAVLLYTIFRDYPVITRSVRFVNEGRESVTIDRAMSLCLDLPDHDYEWMQFSGAWAREKRPITKQLDEGTVLVESLRGHSSANHNPFVILKRKNTDEFKGEAIGAALVYSGNFLTSAEVDTYGSLRLMTGINPSYFSWNL